MNLQSHMNISQCNSFNLQVDTAGSFVTSYHCIQIQYMTCLLTSNSRFQYSLAITKTVTLLSLLSFSFTSDPMSRLSSCSLIRMDRTTGHRGPKESELPKHQMVYTEMMGTMSQDTWARVTGSLAYYMLEEDHIHHEIDFWRGQMGRGHFSISGEAKS